MPLICKDEDSNLRNLSVTDLQSAAFNHSAIFAYCFLLFALSKIWTCKTHILSVICLPIASSRLIASSRIWTYKILVLSQACLPVASWKHNNNYSIFNSFRRSWSWTNLIRLMRPARLPNLLPAINKSPWDINLKGFLYKLYYFICFITVYILFPYVNLYQCEKETL